MSDPTKLVDIHAAYANDGKSNAATMASKEAPADSKILGNQSGLSTVGKGETADHRKFGNGQDVSDDLVNSAPKRGKDLHPSNTYQGSGDEVDESEWD
jgi:hypothetical protein